MPCPAMICNPFGDCRTGFLFFGPKSWVRSGPQVSGWHVVSLLIGLTHGRKPVLRMENGMSDHDYQRIEAAIRFLEQRAFDQPSLEAAAGYVGLSPFHFQRLFKRWAGVSPKRFLQFLTVGHAKQLLQRSSSVLEATYEVGLSSPGRLHDLFVAVEAVTPGEFKSGGVGMELCYGFHDTPFGTCLIALTARGICALSFVGSGGRAQALEDLRAMWSQARLREDTEAGRTTIEKIFSVVAPSEERALPLLLCGTNLQLKVWRALLRIPEGAVVSYQALACAVGRPQATRAVASAVGRNPIAYLIPCHRVLRATGEIGGYRWETARKRAMLGRELAACERAKG